MNLRLETFPAICRAIIFLFGIFLSQSVSAAEYVWPDKFLEPEFETTDVGLWIKTHKAELNGIEAMYRDIAIRLKKIMDDWKGQNWTEEEAKRLYQSPYKAAMTPRVAFPGVVLCSVAAERVASLSPANQVTFADIAAAFMATKDCDTLILRRFRSVDKEFREQHKLAEKPVANLQMLMQKSHKGRIVGREDAKAVNQWRLSLIDDHVEQMTGFSRADVM